MLHIFTWPSRSADFLDQCHCVTSRRFGLGVILARSRLQVEAGGVRADQSPATLAVLGGRPLQTNTAGAFSRRRSSLPARSPNTPPRLKEFALWAALEQSGEKKPHGDRYLCVSKAQQDRGFSWAVRPCELRLCVSWPLYLEGSGSAVVWVCTRLCESGVYGFGAVPADPVKGQGQI